MISQTIIRNTCDRFSVFNKDFKQQLLTERRRRLEVNSVNCHKSQKNLLSNNKEDHLIIWQSTTLKKKAREGLLLVLNDIQIQLKCHRMAGIITLNGTKINFGSHQNMSKMQEKPWTYIFCFDSLHLDVRHNTEEKICHYFCFIATLKGFWQNIFGVADMQWRIMWCRCQ